MAYQSTDAILNLNTRNSLQGCTKSQRRQRLPHRLESATPPSSRALRGQRSLRRRRRGRKAGPPPFLKRNWGRTASPHSEPRHRSTVPKCSGLFLKTDCWRANRRDRRPRRRPVSPQVQQRRRRVHRDYHHPEDCYSLEWMQSPGCFQHVKKLSVQLIDFSKPAPHLDFFEKKKLILADSAERMQMHFFLIYFQTHSCSCTVENV